VRGYLGNQGGRNRPGKRGRGGGGQPDGNRGPRQDELPPDDFMEGGEDLDVISPASSRPAAAR